MIKTLLAALIAAMLLAGGVEAREVANGKPVTDNTGMSISGWDKVTACWRTLTATIDGFLKVQNNSTYRLESTSLMNSTIAGGQVFKTNTPIYARDIGKVTMMMTFAAADTDSIALEVFVLGKLSGNASDGVDAPIDMNPDTERLDGVIVYTNRFLLQPIRTHAGRDSLSLVYAPMTYSPVVNGGTLAAPVTLGAGPTLGVTGISAAAAEFAICPRRTERPVFAYYSFWIVNYSPTRSLTGVSLYGLVRGD